MGVIVGKYLDIELMRILAAFFVIYTHTGTTAFRLFTLYDVHTLSYWGCLFGAVFCKFSVPLFFMISGALLLDRKEEPVKIWMRRVIHIFCILLIWSFFYYLNEVAIGKETFVIKHFLSRVYAKDWNFSYWFLYAYLAFLLSLPLLRRFAQSLTNREYRYLFLLYAVFTMVIPSVQYLLFHGKHGLNGNISVGWLAANIVIFPLAGYVLRHRMKGFWSGKKTLCLWLLNIATILISVYLSHLRGQITGEKTTEAFYNTFVLINAASVFVTCQYWQETSSFLQKLAKPVVSIGGCTFGIYLWHIFIMRRPEVAALARELFRETFSVPPILYGFLYCALVFVIGYGVTWLCRKIPLLRRLVS